MIKNLFYYFRKPVRFNYLDKWLKVPFINILDVGCGDNSPSLTKTYYPNCRYYGIDKIVNYNLSGKDWSVMDKFYKLDLSNCNNLDAITDNFFDCIILSHIIEHLHNGEEIIKKLLNKLKRGGIIYIEFPSHRSVYLPRLKILNFYDDSTHVKIYYLKELKALLISNGCIIIKSGIRRSLKRIIFLPLYFIALFIFYKRIVGGLFWDILSFADFIVAKK